MKDNIVLIGMPGCGKSTVGVVYAKTIGYDFLDLDLVICRRAGDTLQHLLNRLGCDAFLQLEEDAARSVRPTRTVIATGGSVVLRPRGIEWLKSIGKTVFLDVPLNELHARIRNFDTRGIACAPGQTLQDVYAERIGLYRRYAEVTIDCAGLELPEILDALHAARLSE